MSKSGAVLFYGKYGGWESSKTQWEMGPAIWASLKLHAIKPHPKKRIDYLIKRPVLEEGLNVLKHAALFRNRKMIRRYPFNWGDMITESDFDHALVQLPLLLQAPNNTFKIRT